MMKGVAGASRNSLQAARQGPHISARPALVARCTAPVEQAAAAEASASQLHLHLSSAVCYLPHPQKIDTGGEDAHFLSSVLGGAVGVADGVGGWREEGINPAEYSRSLMRVASTHLEQALLDPAHAGPLIDPRAALDVAHTRTRLPGSSTACIIQLDHRSNTLVAANLGDSGFLVIRGGRVITRSKPMQHHFDCPLQLGAFPEFVEVTDSAQQAELFEVAVQAGDIVVAGSDGLWDNAFEHEIISAVANGSAVQDAANALAAIARQHASDPDFASPYIGEALSNGLDLSWWQKLQGASFKDGRFQLGRLSGGKQDDITVIVAAVVEKLSPKAAEPTVQGADFQASEQLLPVGALNC